jgi:hypothetical protein
VRKARKLSIGRTLALAFGAALILGSLGASAQVPSLPVPTALPTLPVPLSTPTALPTKVQAPGAVNDVVTDVQNLLNSVNGSGGGTSTSNRPAPAPVVRSGHPVPVVRGGLPPTSVGPAFVTRRAIANAPGYGTIAGRAAERAAGRALRLAGPFAPPLGLGAIALALLLFLGRGSQPLVKYDSSDARRQRFRL